MKYSYDTLGEECLNRLDEISPPTSAALPRNQSRFPEKENGEPAPKRDLYKLLEDHSSTDEKLGELWKEVNTIPDWVDWEQIERGQEVFYRYGGPALTAASYSHNPSDSFIVANRPPASVSKSPRWNGSSTSDRSTCPHRWILT